MITWEGLLTSGSFLQICLALVANIKGEKCLSSRSDERRTLWSSLRLPIYIARESFSSISHGGACLHVSNASPSFLIWRLTLLARVPLSGGQYNW